MFNKAAIAFLLSAASTATTSIVANAAVADFSDVTSEPIIEDLHDPEAFDTAHIVGIVKATNNIAGQPEHEIVAELTPKPGELVVNKTTQGAFRSTGIDSHLKAMGVKSVVCVGVSTNNCVAMTAMEACDAQYSVVMVSDGTGTDSEEMQDATLTMLQRLWSRVMTTDEVIAELGAT